MRAPPNLTRRRKNLTESELGFKTKQSRRSGPAILTQQVGSPPESVQCLT
jgi:hypothetical protein